VLAVHEQSDLGVIMDTDATHSLLTELQRFTKQRRIRTQAQKSTGSGGHPLDRRHAKRGSALAPSLQRYTGGSKIHEE